MPTRAKPDKSRTVRPGGARGPLWEFYSPRLNRPVSGTGMLRLEYFITVECDPGIASYVPFAPLEAVIDNETLSTVADALITFRDGHRAVHSVAYADDATSASATRFTVERAWADANGHAHHIMTANKIRSEDQLLFNCFTLFPWLSEIHAPSDDDSRAVIGTLVLQTEPISIANLAEAAQREIEVTVAVLARGYRDGLLAIRHVRSKPLAYDTLVTAAKTR